MTFLFRALPARLCVRKGSAVYPLAEYELLEILRYQKGATYDDRWLVADARRPYFRALDGDKEVRHEILISWL